MFGVTRSRAANCSPTCAMELMHLNTQHSYSHYYQSYGSMEGYIGCCVFSLCLVTDISATVALISVKISMMVHNGTGQICHLGPVSLRPPIAKFWPFDREYLENGKSQHYMSTRT